MHILRYAVMEGSLALSASEHASTDVLQKQGTNLSSQSLPKLFDFSDTSGTTNMTAPPCPKATK